MQYYCPACFAKMPFADRDKPCTVCETVAAEWAQTHSYTERLLHALTHPNSEVRMAAIISLGSRRARATTGRVALSTLTALRLATEKRLASLA